MIVAWIIAIIILLLGIIGIIGGIKDNLISEGIDAFIGGIGLTLISIFIIYVIINFSIPNKTPTALDVYRGNTTLEITYRDSIPVDSIVVFKEKVK